MRETQLPSLRPYIFLQTDESLPDEVFQNEVLRPILKLQHQLLVAMFKHGLSKHLQKLEKLSVAERATYIAQLVRTDHRLRHLLVGAVVGHMTLAEYNLLLENENERMRRLVNLLIQRLQSVEMTVWW